jgi:tRNA-dihydrouridine synthase
MKIVMAPLRGVTTAVYRRVYKAHFDGVDTAMAPFISTGQAAKVSNKLVRELLPETNIDSYPITPQLLGNNPDHLPPFLEKLREIGCTEVNWNLGCPAVMVTKKKRGSGLLPHADMVEKYIEVLDKFKGMEYSVKVRSGFNHEDELIKLLPLFEKHNCKEITVHPRTGSQGYAGRANPDLFGKVAEKTTLPLVYNGDILYREYFDEVMEKFGDRISGIMLGRGLLVNPFLPQQLKGIEIPKDSNDHVHALMESLFKEYEKTLFGLKPVLGRMKELWRYLQYSFPEGERQVKKIMKCTSLDTYNKRVDALFKYDFTPPTEYPSLEF